MKQLFIKPLTSSQILALIEQDSKWKTSTQNSCIVDCLVPMNESDLHSESLCNLAIHEFLFSHVLSQWSKYKDFLIQDSLVHEISVDSFVVVDTQVISEQLHVLFKAKITFMFEKTALA